MLSDAATLPICQWRKSANQRLHVTYCFEHDLLGKPLRTFPDHARRPTGASTVSRHHTLPPIVYTPPPPEPKKTRRRRGVGTASGARETDETEEAGDVGNGAPVRSAPVLPRHSRPIEATERRTGSPNGKLSADTLRAMLDLQEQQTK
jgi:hypothetical protein